jgi:CheY-like chemotaxis protein
VSTTRSILLVEDDPNDVLLIHRAFERAKVLNPLRVLPDGDEAIRYLAGLGPYADRAVHPLPALMLLDLKLPRRGGLEVLGWVRDQPGLRRLPVVVLSSSRRTEDVSRAYDLGANSYLVKPVGFKPLLALIRSLDVYWVLFNEKADLTP